MKNNILGEFLPNTRIIKNVSFLLVGEIFAKIMMFLITIYLARSLSPEFYGRYSIAFNFVMGFLFLVDFGMNTILLRDGSKDINNLSELINKAFTFKLYSGLATIFLINSITIFFLPYDQNQKILIAIASILVLLKELINVVNITFRAVERMNYNSMIRILEVIIFSTIVFISLQFYNSPKTVIYSWIASMIIVLIIQYILSNKFIKRKVSLKIDISFCKQIIKQSFWIGIAMFLASLYGNINVLILSILLGASSVAFYSVAWQLTSMGTLFRGVISDAIFPNTCKKINTKGYANKLLKYITVVSIISALGALVITSLSKYIITIAFGKEYINSIIILQILIWYVPLFIYNIWACQVLDSTNNQKYHVYSEIIIIVATILLSYGFIKNYGVIGAAIATITARIIGTIVLNYYASKIIKNLKVN